MKLTAERVDAIVDECLHPGRSPFPEGVIVVRGVGFQIGFDSEKLEARRSDVIEMLQQLPLEFREDRGGGWSFLNACVTRDGALWGEQIHVDKLVCLAIGLKLGSFPMSREFWPALPGGMPYFTVSKDVPEVGS